MLTLTSFALSTNLKISTPEIQQEFVPIELDLSKTILIYAGLEKPNCPSFSYDLWNDVIGFSSQQLLNHGYSFLQVGSEQDVRIRAQNHLMGLNPNQMAYIIANSALLLTTDNSYAHLAGVYDTKLIALYGPTPSHSNAPFFGRKENQRLIRQDVNKPSFSPQEFPKTVNFNRPEVVSQEIFNLLGISYTVSEKTVFMGKFYPALMLEIIPNAPLAPHNFTDKELNVRMDYHFDEQILCNILEGRKCSIVTNLPINLNIIKHYKKNITVVNYKIDKNTDVNYCKLLKNTGVKILFYSEESGQELAETRFAMLDLALVDEITKHKKPLDFDTKNPDTCILQFRSHKFLLSRHQIYPSRAHEQLNIPIPTFGQNYSHYIDSDLFWEDAEMFYIYKI